MSTLIELDYIGLSDASSSMEKLASEKHSTNFNLKETELRLGLPGSMSPERNSQLGFPLFDEKTNNGYSVLKNSSVSGAKRGFSDASIKWGLSVNGGSEVDLVKSSDFSPGLKDGCAVLEKKTTQIASGNDHGSVPAAKAQVVGWPPIRSFRKNSMATSSAKTGDDVEAKLGEGCLYVKVSMDGAPYLRKVDLKIYTNYKDLSSALEKMFSCFTIGQCGSHGISESRLMDLLHGSEYVLTYEDKDGDWMLVGDVPWNMFTSSCRRMRIMKGSEAIGLAPRAMEKCKTRN